MSKQKGRRRRVEFTMNDLTPEQQKELDLLAIEIEAEAIQLKKDYENNPSNESGSIVVVHENAEFLNEDKTSAEAIAEFNPDGIDYESEVTHSSADRFGTEWSDKYSLDDEEE